ncbi:MAG TPA: type VI immunity family protein [Steroidobacteraceae bacterium]
MIDLGSLLTVRYQEGYGEFVVYRPAITLNFYMSLGTPESGARMAEGIELFLTVVPGKNLQCYKKANGEHATLDARVVRRDLKKLRSPDVDLVEMRYYAGSPGNLGEYGLVVEANRFEPAFPEHAHLLRFDLPHNILAERDPDWLLDLVAQLGTLVPFETGSVGFALTYLGSHEREAYRALTGYLPRYLGLDPAHVTSRRYMRNHTPDAHWVTLLGNDMVQRLGGGDRVRESLPRVPITSVTNGLLLRGAALPPVGDVNRGANDIGQLPEIARLLKPFRFNPPWLFSDGFDVPKWLARFDDRAAEDWDNAKL